MVTESPEQLLPRWALRAFEAQRIKASDDQHLEAMRDRFASAWTFLDAHVWSPLKNQAADAGIASAGGLGGIGWEIRLPAVVLESAIRTGLEYLDKDVDHGDIRKSVRKLDQINSKISELAQELADLLRERTEVLDAGKVGESVLYPPRVYGQDWLQPREDQASDLESLLRRNGCDLKYEQVNGELPALEDILQSLADRPIGCASAHSAADFAVLSGGGLVSFSTACRRFSARLSGLGWLGLDGLEKSPDSWISDAGKAYLCGVACGEYPHFWRTDNRGSAEFENLRLKLEGLFSRANKRSRGQDSYLADPFGAVLPLPKTRKRSQDQESDLVDDALDNF